MPIPHRGVFVRQIMEMIQDCDCDEKGKHGDCLRLSVAACWPVPHPWHDLGSVTLFEDFEDEADEDLPVV